MVLLSGAGAEAPQGDSGGREGGNQTELGERWGRPRTVGPPTSGSRPQDLLEHGCLTALEGQRFYGGVSLLAPDTGPVGRQQHVCHTHSQPPEEETHQLGRASWGLRLGTE